MTDVTIGWVGVGAFWICGPLCLLFRRYVLLDMFYSAARLDQEWYESDPSEQRMTALRGKCVGMQALCSVLAGTSFAIIFLVVGGQSAPSSTMRLALTLVAAASAFFLVALEAITTAVSPSCLIEEHGKLMSFGRKTYQLGFGCFVASMQVILIQVDGRIAAALCFLLFVLFWRYLSIRYIR